ncbi:hypothetical protein HNY73_009562 [Argiope bruennichi]|uniref:Uncharacterized protein n=1 Tax=Argiope bruennichi TaxID=94029 RepID=A0A8T0F9W1_ARGBR|nr:hypothetical protein HNY73_009562 [Argiope bruennichi]
MQFFGRLWCSGFLFSLSYGENIVEENPSQIDDGNRYTFRYGLVNERYKDEERRNKPFHDIFAVKSLSGETERVHYAVDNHGIRTNIHSNAVKFGPKIDTHSINFGSRFTEWPSDNFDSMFLRVPEANVQNSPTHNIPEKVVPVPSLELPPAFVTLRSHQSPIPPQPLNLNPVINRLNPENENPKEKMPSSVIPESILPFPPPEFGYESQRISKPFLPRLINPTGNSPIAGHTIANEEQLPQSNSQKTIPFERKSEDFSKQLPSSPPLPEFAPRLSNLKFIQHQYANNQNLKWYQSLPQVPPAMSPMYSAPFYPIGNKFEPQRNVKQSPNGLVSAKETLQKELNPIKLQNNNQEAILPKPTNSGSVPETETPQMFPNINYNEESQKFSNYPVNIQDSMTLIEPQQQKINKNIQHMEAQPKQLPSTIGSQSIELEKISNLPVSNSDSDAIFESQTQGADSNINQYARSQKFYNQTENLPSTIISLPQKTLINTNQYVEFDKISNTPTKPIDPQFDSQLYSQDFLPNINQYVKSQKFSNQPEQLSTVIRSRPQTTLINTNQQVKYEKYSNIPIKSIDSAFNSQLNSKDSFPNANQYAGSELVSNQPDQFSNTTSSRPQKTLINTNQYVKPEKNSNIPIKSIDSSFDSRLKSQNSFLVANQYTGIPKATSQAFKPPNAFPDQIIRNQPPAINGISSFSPKSPSKSIFSSTKQPPVLSKMQNKLQAVINSKLSTPSRKHSPFLISKSLVSSPMSTVFDTSNENGQYYHYVMNMGKKSDNTTPNRLKLSTVNLFKLLNDTTIRKSIDNKMLSGKIIQMNYTKVVNDIKKPTVDKLEKNTDKKIGNALKSDLDVSSDAIDATEIFQDLPEITISDVTLEQNDDKQVSDKVIDEITTIMNTEEPHPSTETTNTDIRSISTAQPKIEQTTSSFLEDLFEINTTPTEMTTNNNNMESTNSISEEGNTEYNKELEYLFITLPDQPLSSLFYEGNIQNATLAHLEEINSENSTTSDIDTSNSISEDEIQTTEELSDSKHPTPTTTNSYETSTFYKDTSTTTEASTLAVSTETGASTFAVSTETEASSSTSISSEITIIENLFSDTSEDLQNATSAVSFSSSTMLIPNELISTASPTLFKEMLNGNSDISTEEPTATALVPTSSILVDVVNPDITTTNNEVTDLTEIPTLKTEQPKPMLELVIQDTEMNDFMSRINNMPIMIRVLNPLTTTTQTPDIDKEILTTEKNSDLNLNTILSNTENIKVDVTSTEATTLTSLNIKEINATDVPEEDISTINQKLLSTQSSTDANVIETLKIEPNIEDSITLPSAKPQNTISSLSDIDAGPTEKKSSQEIDLTTPVPKSRESSTVVLLKSQSPEVLQYTLIKPENSRTVDSSLLGNTDFESSTDYTNKLVSTAQNYNNDETTEVHEDKRSTEITPLNDDEPFIPMFVDSEQVRASEESQNIANFKLMNNNREAKSFAVPPRTFHSPSQPIIIKNSTVIQYQDISNYKGYDHRSPVQYVDYVPFKDIDYDSHVPLSNEEKFPSDALYVLDDYDVLPSNVDGQNNEYVLIGNNDNFESDILQTSGLAAPIDYDSQPVYILDSNTAKFGTRFQEEIPKVESRQEKVPDTQQLLPLNFKTFRPQKSFESNSDFRKEQWFPSQK